MEYFPTQEAYEKSLLEKNNNTNDKQENEKSVKTSETSSNQQNKRPLPESDSSSNEDVKKGKSVLRPRRKSIRLSEKEDNDNINNKDNEINNIKATQQNLEKQVLEIKNLFEQFTIQWFNNTNTSQSGNGSSSTNLAQ